MRSCSCGTELLPHNFINIGKQRIMNKDFIGILLTCKECKTTLLISPDEDHFKILALKTKKLNCKECYDELNNCPVFCKRKAA